MTIRLGGELTIDRMIQVFAQFAEVLVALHEHQGANVTWMLDGLEHGSASATAKAIPLDDRSESRIPAMCDEYIQAARQVASGDANREQPLYATVYRISELASQDNPVTFETDSDTVVLKLPDGATTETVEEQATESFGTVRGRVEVLSHRGSLTFNLYELLTDRAVRCNLDESFEDKMREAWGHVVDVSGTISREAGTGRPLRIRSVESVEIVEDGESGAYIKAKGALSNREPAEAIIRKLRDGE